MSTWKSVRPVYFQGGAVCIMRVFTRQSYQNIPFKELYGFFLLPDGSVLNFDYRQIEAAHNADAATGQKLPPEPGVIYSNLNNNKLPSFEID